METTDPQTPEERIRNLAPPKSADASMVLNGAGNGMMLGGIPLIVSQLYAKLAHVKLPRTLSIASEGAVVVGGVVGAFYGKKEARDLKNYRAALRDELADLRGRTDDHHERIVSWAEKEKEKTATPAEPSR